MRFSLPSIKCLAALPASVYCRARGNQIVEHSSDNEKVFGRSRKLGGTGPRNIWLTITKNALVGWALNFRVHTILKSAVMNWDQVSMYCQTQFQRKFLITFNYVVLARILLFLTPFFYIFILNILLLLCFMFNILMQTFLSSHLSLIMTEFQLRRRFYR